MSFVFFLLNYLHWERLCIPINQCKPSTFGGGRPTFLDYSLICGRVQARFWFSIIEAFFNYFQHASLRIYSDIRVSYFLFTHSSSSFIILSQERSHAFLFPEQLVYLLHFITSVIYLLSTIFLHIPAWGLLQVSVEGCTIAKLAVYIH